MTNDELTSRHSRFRHSFAPRLRCGLKSLRSTFGALVLAAGPAAPAAPEDEAKLPPAAGRAVDFETERREHDFGVTI